MMQFAVQYMSEADQRAAAIARRARIMGPQKATKAIATPVTTQTAEKLKTATMWKVGSPRYCHHVLAFRAQSSPVEFMRLMAIDAGYTLDDIYAKNTNRKLVDLKKKIAYSIHQKFDISLSEIGRIMKVDHSTVISRIRTYGTVRKTAKKVYKVVEVWQTGVDEKVKAMFEAGKSSEAIEAETGIPSKMIRDKGREQGWYLNPRELAYIRFMREADKGVIARMHRSGLAFDTIAGKTGFTPLSIKRYISGQGDKSPAS